MVIEAIEVSRKYGKIVGLESASFAIDAGEIFGYIGENGAGKTTTIHLLTGLLSPSTGKVSVLGKDPYKDKDVRKKFSVLLETNGLYEDLTIEENLSFYAFLYEIKNNSNSNTLLEKFDLLKRKKDKVRSLSKGMKQKVALIRALSLHPLILFLDEPTSGLDPLSQQEVREMIKVCAEGGTTVFFSSHNLTEVEDICTRVGILKKGRLLLVDSISKIQRKFGQKILDITLEEAEKEKAISIINANFPSLTVREGENHNLYIPISQEEVIPQINKAFALSNIFAKEIKVKTLKLEEVYKKLMDL